MASWRALARLVPTQVFAGALMITVFYGALLASAYLFSLVDPVAGLLMVPTCVEINQCVRL